MRLSTDQYRQGFVRWRTAGFSTVQTATGPDESAPLSYSAPLTDPSGSAVESPPRPHRGLKLNPESLAGLGEGCRIVWDRLFDGDIEALVIDPAAGVAQVMSGLPDVGRFRHVVVAVPHLDWDEDTVFRVADVVVRLVKQGRLLPPGQAPPNAARPAAAALAERGQEPRVERFVEIVVPDRGDLAFSILGLLALVVGDAAVGDVVGNDTREFVPEVGGTEYAVTLLGRGTWLPSSVGLTLHLPVLVSDEHLDVFDRSLAALAAERPVPEKLALALRWYERGLRSFSPADRLLASFVGIEAIATAVSDANRFRSPIADLLSDDRIPALLAPLAEQHGADNVDRLRKRLVDKRPSMLDRFDFAAGQLGLPAEASARFRSAKGSRDAVMHGSSKAVGHEAASAASDLLAEAARATIGWLQTEGSARP